MVSRVQLKKNLRKWRNRERFLDKKAQKLRRKIVVYERAMNAAGNIVDDLKRQLDKLNKG